jgi:Fic family protein
MKESTLEYLYKRRELFNGVKDKINSIELNSYKTSFELTYIHDTTVIEGNTLSIFEMKTILEDGIQLAGKSVRELYDIKNTQNVFRVIQQNFNREITIDFIRELHKGLTENILDEKYKGKFRDIQVYISGATKTPPKPEILNEEMEKFIKNLECFNSDPISLAVYTHAELVRIHPFIDGNGRTARMLMNFILMKNGFLPITISLTQKYKYYNALDVYCLTGNINPLLKLVVPLENEQLDKYIKMGLKGDVV